MKGCSVVQLVILLKWSEISQKRVKGTAEVWRRDAAGTLVSEEMVCICIFRWASLFFMHGLYETSEAYLDALSTFSVRRSIVLLYGLKLI